MERPISLDEQRRRRARGPRLRSAGTAEQDKKLPVKPIEIDRASVNALNRGVVADKKQEEARREDGEKEQE